MREDEKKQSSRGSSIKRFFKKRWVIPAIYIAGAAIILTGVLWYQSARDNSENLDYNATDISGKKINEEPAIEVNRAMENFVMPVSTPEDVVIQKQFYEYDGKKEEQVAALVEYNNSYHPNTGIDITMKDKKSFDVVASLSGTVTDVREDSLLGNVVEIEHDKGIVTQYSSVSDIQVEAGDEVEQGQPIAKAGKSLYNEEAGIHVHFEIRKDNIAVNPSDYFNKPLNALQEANVEDKKPAADDDSSMTEEEEATDDNVKEEKESTNEDKPAEDKKSTEDNKSSDEEKSVDDSGKSEDDSQSGESEEEDAESGNQTEDSKKPTESSMNS